MNGAMKWLLIVALAACAAGCGSSRMTKLETDMLGLQAEVSELSKKVDEASDLKADMDKLEERMSSQSKAIDNVREAYLSMLTLYRDAQKKVLESLESSIEQLGAE